VGLFFRTFVLALQKIKKFGDQKKSWVYFLGFFIREIFNLTLNYKIT
jgi:hypothetical protein